MVLIAVPGVSRSPEFITDLQFITPKCVWLNNGSQHYVRSKKTQSKD